MLENCEDKRERWQAVENLLQGWLKERREVLVKFTAVAAGLESGSAVSTGIQRLCELLVDYTSAGHFEIYYELLREAEAFADGSDGLAPDLISRIGDTTEVILGFDDKYSDASGSTATLEQDMSLLGEVLESRFELEDRLIAVLHKVHASA